MIFASGSTKFCTATDLSLGKKYERKDYDNVLVLHKKVNALPRLRDFSSRAIRSLC